MIIRQILFVRHGEMEGNIANSRSRKGDHSDFTPEFMNRHSTDLRLTSKGRQQAKAVGDWLRQNNLAKFEHFFVSPYARALETASLLGLDDAGWVIDRRLRERSYGSVDILPDNERQVRLMEYYSRLPRNHHFYTRLPDGESIEDVCNYLRPLIEDLCNFDYRGNGRVIVVAHGNVIQGSRVLLEGILPDYYDKRSKENSTEFKIGNGQIVQYICVDPHNPEHVLQDRFGWVRSVNPWNPKYAGHDWREIEDSPYSNEKLMVLAERSKRLVAE